MNIAIDMGTRVTMHFSLALESGEIIDSNFERHPATFTLGDGNLLPSFEAILIGLRVGDQREFVVTPENAFGQRNPENMQDIARSNFDQDDLQPGAVLSFQNANGELPGVIIAVGSDQVSVDFNHPLSGHTIVFRVNIVHIAPDAIH